MPEIGIKGYAEPMGKASRASLEGQVSSIDRSELADILRALERHRGRPGPIRAAPIPRSADEGAPANDDLSQPPRSVSPPRLAPAIRNDDAEHDLEIDLLVADLLRNHPDPSRAFIQATARQVAMSLKMIANLSGTILAMIRESGPEGILLKKIEMLTKMKAMETKSVGRLLLTLELARDRQVPVEVHSIAVGRGRSDRRHLR